MNVSSRLEGCGPSWFDRHSIYTGRVIDEAGSDD